MKFMTLTKWISCMLILVLVLTLGACGKSDDVSDNTSDTTTTTATDTTAPAVTVENITMAQLTDYVLVRPEDAGDGLVKAVVELRSALINSLESDLMIKSDLYSDTVPALKIGEFEILIGACDRDESRQFAENLKKDDYGYAMIGKKLVIAGGSEEATIKALEQFVLDPVKQHDAASELFYDGTLSVMQKGNYDIDTMTLQGSNIAEYVIVYPQRDKSAQVLANELSARIAQASGYVLTVTGDKAEKTDKEILIGTTNRTDNAATTQTLEAGTYLISADGTTICARGADGIGDYYAVYALIAALLENTSAAHQVTLAASDLQTVPVADTLKAMSFNVWVSSPTPERMTSVLQTIMNYMPDTIGVQEASPTWMSYLNAQLGNIYAYVGDGRDGGSRGEHSAIFYRKDRFELIETGTKWMSDTPDKVSKFSESSLNRVFTYAILLEKNSNTEIMYVNTHLEHTGAEARNKQIKVLMDFLKDYTQYPIVLTGDFNANPSSEVYKLITETLADSSEIAQTAERSYTFHNYGSSSSYIDFVFVSQQSIAVSHYRVITEKANGMLPSDHYPLITEYRVMN